nr:MAG TPA: hypothetical protein [Caudoviricetes sp.]
MNRIRKNPEAVPPANEPSKGKKKRRFSGNGRTNQPATNKLLL